VVGPPFATHAHEANPNRRPSAPRSHTAPSHASRSGPSDHPPATAIWAGSDMPLVEHRQFPGHTSNTLASGHVPVDTTQHSGTSWPVQHDEAPVSSSDYDQAHAEEHWGLVQRQDSHEPYAQHPAYQHPTNSSAPTQGSRRSSLKKKAAKVPSSFVERQEKLKVSRRKGPLQEKQREKTHTMRKTKRICVRCRFYKSGVCCYARRKVIWLTNSV
jgi:hypothetical protein